MSGFIIIVGDTDDKGKMLVPNLTPYVPSEIRLDDENYLLIQSLKKLL